MNNDVTRHPIRGALWGLLFGIGVYFLLVGRKVVAIGSWGPVIIVMVASVVVNVLWSMFGPARAAKPPKGMMPSLPVEPAAMASMSMAPPPPVPTEQWLSPPRAPGEPPPPPVPPDPGI